MPPKPAKAAAKPAAAKAPAKKPAAAAAKGDAKKEPKAAKAADKKPAGSKAKAAGKDVKGKENKGKGGAAKKGTMSSGAETPRGVAFEVKFEEAPKGEAPARLKEQAGERSAVTKEELEKKLEEAEQRRTHGQEEKLRRIKDVTQSGFIGKPDDPPS